jgi:hypothetical protein
MSQSIWTLCGGRSSARPLTLRGLRAVESQFVNSTRKLVDSDEEQALLEALVDEVKPPLPAGIGKAGLHYLLFTPFRHPPLRNGSRFGTRHERGIFYGALEVATVMAEVAYYRLVFLEGTTAELGLVETPLTVFAFKVRTKLGVDLTAEPFLRHQGAICSPTRYAASQRLGRQMREDGVEAALFRSARDPQHGTNLALFAPAFAGRRPERVTQQWQCNATLERVEVRRLDPLGLKAGRFIFPRATFLVAGRLPSPAV